MSQLVNPTLKEIQELQAYLAKLPQVTDTITRHHFAGGMYCRELERKAGTLIVGKVHKKEHFFMVIKGHLRVWSDKGIIDMKAPYILISSPGTKRVTFAVEDTIACTVHKTESKDVFEIEKELIEEDLTSLFDANNEIFYSIEKFRNLTTSVISKEKHGFWSDWSEAEQKMYMDDDWQGFSLSRGYSDDEIKEYGRWRKMALDGKRLGFKPFHDISDLAEKAAIKNMSKDINNEIKLSSIQHSWQRGIL